MKPFFRNLIQTIEFEGGLVPLRFSESQMAYFDPTPYRFRSYNAAGICLDFVTDSPYVRLAYRAKIKPNTTEKLLFDIYVQDRLVAYPGIEITNKGEGEWKVDLPILPGQPQRVTVYLPYHARIIVDRFEVAEGSVLEPAPLYDQNLLCLGDSITQGMNALHPSFTYAVQLSRHLGMNLLNQGVSGYVFDANTIDPELPYKPDLITVAYGTNDWATRPNHDDFEQHARAYLDKLDKVYPEVPIAILSPIWRRESVEAKPAGEFGSIHRTLYRLYEDLKARHRASVTYIDGWKLVPAFEEFFADGLHPTDEGFLHMALNIVKGLK